MPCQIFFATAWELHFVSTYWIIKKKKKKMMDDSLPLVLYKRKVCSRQVGMHICIIIAW